MDNPTHEIAKQIRHQFFVYRNGMLADTLRDAGNTHKLIFGLNIPQIVNIANQYKQDAAVATELWNSSEARECRLIAPMLYPVKELDEETASTWISQIEDIEIADNMCHKLLRKVPFTTSLCERFSSGSHLERYTMLRLAINMLTINAAIDIPTFTHLAQKELQSESKQNAILAKQLLDDLDEIGK